MRFLSIYKGPERNTPPTQQEMAEMGKYIEESMKRGILISTEGCHPSSAGARVRVDNGKYTVKDGPFTEAKEVVGGFAILEAPSKDAAIGFVKEFLAKV
ncbi:MAG TPA: YciI family protein, partial [Terracidiphilus sp.]|nr:YciI family protein [Terracidiphilus sp.]